MRLVINKKPNVITTDGQQRFMDEFESYYRQMNPLDEATYVIKHNNGRYLTSKSPQDKKSQKFKSKEDALNMLNGLDWQFRGNYKVVKESLDEAIKPSLVQTAVNKVKKSLIAKWKKKGGYENFGEKELRKLKDKFNYDPYGTPDERRIASILDNFDKWAMNYAGESMDENKSGEIEDRIRQSFLMDGWKMSKRQFDGLVKNLKGQFGDVVDKLIKELMKYKYIETKGSQVVWNESLDESIFYVFWKKKKHEIEAKDLYSAKLKAIEKFKIPKSKQGMFAIMSKDAYDNQEFRMNSLEQMLDDVIEQFHPDMMWVGKGAIVSEAVKPKVVSNMERELKLKAEYEPITKSWEIMNANGVVKYNSEFGFWEFYKNGQFLSKQKDWKKSIKIAKEITK